MAISDEITRLQQAKADLKTAIEGKGVTVPSSTKLDGYADLVDSISGGAGGGNEEKTVKFMDYDGSIAYSYGPTEFANLSDLPDVPDHSSEGLVSLTWNWTLSEAKTYVQNNKNLYIGAHYTTNNTATRITIDITGWETLSINLSFKQSKSQGVEVDFGDGSLTQRLSSASNTNLNFTHTYASEGIYVISLTPDADCKIIFGGDLYYRILSYNLSNSLYGYRNAAIRKINCGSRVTIADYAFYTYYTGLTYITIATDTSITGQHCFNNCSNLKYITIPRITTSLKLLAFYYCYSLKYISLPKTFTSSGLSATNIFASAGLEDITIPDTVTSLGIGLFSSCDKLCNITVPSSVTSLGRSCFNRCESLHSISLPGLSTLSGTGIFLLSGVMHIFVGSVTNIPDETFYECKKLRSLESKYKITTLGSKAFYLCPIEDLDISGVTTFNTYSLYYSSRLTSVTLNLNVTTIPDNTFYYGGLLLIEIPNSVTSIGASAFSNCNKLLSIILPNSLTTIGSSAFSYMSNLRKIEIPSSVTSIGTSAFHYDLYLECIVFLGTTPPTLRNTSNSLGQTSYTFPIYVPDSAVETYKSAYTNYASRIKGISERPSEGG